MPGPKRVSTRWRSAAVASLPAGVGDVRSRRDNIGLVLVILATFVVLSFLVFGAFGIWEGRDNSANAANSAAQTKQLTQQLITSGDNHHAETAKQNKTIIRLEEIIAFGEQLLINDHAQTESEIADIATLQRQLVSIEPVIEGLPAADSYLATLARNLIIDVNALCQGNSACVQIPVPSP